MSMANYPVVLPAVFIIDEEVAKLLGTEGADDAYDILNAEGVQDIQRASDFAGTVSYLNKELLPTGEEMQLDDDIIVYLPLDYEPSLLVAAYSSLDEIVEEIRDKLEPTGFFPEGFEYEAHLTSICGTTFC